MRYDWKTEITADEFSKEFYDEIDRRFFSSVYSFMPWNVFPFDPVLDFQSLIMKDVLEIGVGNGTHAQLIAPHCRTYTGIDLTEYAVHSTSTRLKLNSIRAEIVRMDAEHMAFPDESFDFIWSWGVIHHSSNTQNIIRQIHRVLRPGGKAAIMVYHKGWWNYYIVGSVILGLLRGEFFRSPSLHTIIQRHTDGAMARYYTFRDWENAVRDMFTVTKIRTVGNKPEVLLLPGGWLKSKILNIIPDICTRFLTNTCRMGSMLYCEMEVLK